MNIECRHTIEIDIKPNGFTSRPMSIILSQLFDIELMRGREVDWTADGIPGARVMVGNVEMWEGDARDLPGWMATEATHAMLADDFAWDIDNAQALEMLMNAEDDRAHQAEHAAGRI